ncbi:hypothetical protein BY996DRAFT_8385599 [Phakopsora pachyrhizi]|uniref:RmlD-like substrate binding domain-containing protein n=1 Tax=Phakopsora pachyrhizi TaxID=170000 RepID=A0AAV0BP29_PHAPC|nr:hypothetical protein BY996DRAFT_8385599 [Phakopsora pachyrhizi]CAH7687317.1 hypothetical protein PPACK8108_LOCUS22089 [Phakopsora pachyrhizi]
MKVVVTGASGLLGRAVFSKVSSTANHQVQGWAFSRATNGLVKVDVRDRASMEGALKEFKADVVIHCAAERRPDVAEKDPTGTQSLNVEVTENLTELSNQLGFKLIYICTDYVFDGNAPPDGYDVDATPNPTNFYGKTKLEGEKKLIELGRPGKVVSLRVPVLYGRTEKNDESAINVLLDGVMRASEGQKVKMDDWALRFPTLVDDIAAVILQIIELDRPLPKILHFSSTQQYTKYSISLTFSRILNLSQTSISNLVRVYDPPKSDESTVRPKNCRLSNRSIEELGIDTSKTVSFEDWWKDHLKDFLLK